MLRDTQRYKFYLIETHKWEVEFFRSERDAGDFSRKRECRGTKDAGEYGIILGAGWVPGGLIIVGDGYVVDF